MTQQNAKIVRSITERMELIDLTFQYLFDFSNDCCCKCAGEIHGVTDAGNKNCSPHDGPLDFQSCKIQASHREVKETSRKQHMFRSNPPNQDSM